MKLFTCQRCGQQLYFENTSCESCNTPLGYLTDRGILSALDACDQGDWALLADPAQKVRFCANAAHDACNWLISADRSDDLCKACRLNQTIPDLSIDRHVILWRRLELAKHRLVYGLIRFGLPLMSKTDDPRKGLAFDFLADGQMTFKDGPGVMTGHAQGLITINLAEADDAVREQARQDMAEPYRTILGHFRHEIGHYYWERLVAGKQPWIEQFRTLFGNERQDYAECLERHHAHGPSTTWHETFISSYASAHPWEDFAESWAHYMHIADTLETASAFGLSIDPAPQSDPSLSAEIDFDPYREDDFDRLLEAWLPVTFAVNSLNKSMGQPEFYPFVLTPDVMEKFRFIHRLIRSSTTATGDGAN